MAASVAGTFLMSRVSPRKIILACTVATTVVLLIASFATSWSSFFILYAFGWPLAMGPAYFVPVVCAWEWLPEKKSTITGLIVCGYGFGTTFFGLLTTAIVNPENLTPEVEGLYFPLQVAERVPEMIRACAAGYFCLMMFSLLTVKKNPDFVINL